MSTMTGPDFGIRTTAILEHLEETGQLKHMQMIEGPMGPTITIRGVGEVACFCVGVAQALAVAVELDKLVSGVVGEASRAVDVAPGCGTDAVCDGGDESGRGVVHIEVLEVLEACLGGG